MRRIIISILPLLVLALVVWGCTKSDPAGSQNRSQVTAAPDLIGDDGHDAHHGGGGGGMGSCDPNTCTCADHTDCGNMMGGPNCDPDCPSCGGMDGDHGGMGECNPDSCTCPDHQSCGDMMGGGMMGGGMSGDDHMGGGMMGGAMMDSMDCVPDCPGCGDGCGGMMGDHHGGNGNHAKIDTEHGDHDRHHQ